MKRLRLLLGTALVSVVAVFAGVQVAHAQRFTATTTKDDVVNGTLYSSGKTVDINGVVNGDVFCAGQNVRVNATVTGDVICAGQNVTIEGKVDGDIRVAGQNVNVSAQVTRNATIAAQSFTLFGDAKIGGDITATGENLLLKGSVGRDAIVGGTSVVIEGLVGRNIKGGLDALRLKENAKIGGKIDYTSSNELQKDPGATVVGPIHQDKKTASEPHNEWAAFGFGFALAWYLYVLVAFALVSLLLVLLFPQAMEFVSAIARRELAMSLLVGFLAGILIPVAVVLLMISVVGIPLALFLLLIWALLAVLSGPVAAYTIGRVVLRNNRQAVLAMLVGSLILITGYFIPFVCFIVMLAAYWIGIGAILIALKRRTPAAAHQIEVATSPVEPAKPTKKSARKQ